MKKIIMIILLLSFCSISYAEEVWKITSLDWQPYSGSRMTNQGNSIQKLKNLLAKKDIQLQVEFYPWARAQKIAEKEDYTGYFPAWPEEVKDGFVASPPIDQSQIAVMKNINVKIKYNNLSELFANYKIGIVRTYAYPVYITDVMSKFSNNISPVPSEKALAKMLNVNRFSFAITDPNVMTFLANQQGLENISVLKVLNTSPLVISLTKNSDTKRKNKLLRTLLKQEISNN